MQTNSTTVICFQKMTAIDQHNNTALDNTTQIMPVLRVSPKSQLWIPYVLIGFSCVAFLAVHFWCYHKRNRARYLRKREEIRVKCGLLERRRIATLMMARKISEQQDAENNTKEESEENALLAHPFYNQDNDYFHSQPEENSYYETLLDKKGGVKKPQIGCCLTCSASMPVGMKSLPIREAKKEAFVYHSKSLGDSNFDRLGRSDQQLQPLESCYRDEENDTMMDYNDEGFYLGSPFTASGISLANYENGRFSSDIDERNSCNISEQDDWKGSVGVNEIMPVEGNAFVKIETNTFPNNGNGYDNQLLPYSCIPNEATDRKNTKESIQQNNGLHDLVNIAPHSPMPMSANDILSREDTSGFNRDTVQSNLEMNTIPADELLDTISNVNIVDDNDKNVDNDYQGDLQVSPIRPASSQPDDTDDEGKQSGLKTPSIRSLNPRLVFENLHNNTK